MVVKIIRLIPYEMERDLLNRRRFTFWTGIQRDGKIWKDIYTNRQLNHIPWSYGLRVKNYSDFNKIFF